MKDLIETERLILRRFLPTDFDLICPMLEDERVMALTGFAGALGRERIAELLQQWSESNGVWGAFARDDSDFVGWIMLKPTSFADPEIGFMLPVKHWAKGFATEMARAIIQAGREDLNLQRIVATTKPQNKASIGVLVKLGMRKFQPRPQSDNLDCYELLLGESHHGS